MRVVVDTNVWVSGFIRPEGPPGRVVDAVRTHRVVALASWPLLAEATTTLAGPRLAVYGIAARADEVAQLVEVYVPNVEFKVAIRDPDDAAVVLAAIASDADAIVTGDKDLLDDAELRRWLADREIEGMTPAEFLARLGG